MLINRENLVSLSFQVFFRFHKNNEHLKFALDQNRAKLFRMKNSFNLCLSFQS